MSRRISHWEKLDTSGRVRGVALQDLGLDCFATYCTAIILPVHSGGWDVLLDRAGFQTVRLHAPRRVDAMMAVEHEVAVRWGHEECPACAAGVCSAHRAAERPAPIPLADLSVYRHFWKQKLPFGPQPEPRYMALLTAEHRRVATLPSGAGWAEFSEDLGGAGARPPELPHGDD